MTSGKTKVKVPSLALDKTQTTPNMMMNSARSGKSNGMMLISDRQAAKRSTEQDIGDLTLGTRHSLASIKSKGTNGEVQTPKLGKFNSFEKVDDGEEDDRMSLSGIDSFCD